MKEEEIIKELEDKIRPLIYERPNTAEDANDNTIKAKNFICQALQSYKDWLWEEIEELIQKERFAGAPYALSKVQSLIKPEKK